MSAAACTPVADAVRDKVLAHLNIPALVTKRYRRLAAAKGMGADELEAEARLALVHAAGEVAAGEGDNPGGMLHVATRWGVLAALRKHRAWGGWPRDGDGEPVEMEAPPDREAGRRELKEYVASLLRHLPGRERMVVGQCFGLGGGEPLTLGEIAGGLGVSQQRVAQLLARALGRLRDQLQAEA